MPVDNEPVYVKNLFEEDFIDKFITFLYSKELAYEKYDINVNKIEQICIDRTQGRDVDREFIKLSQSNLPKSIKNKKIDEYLLKQAEHKKLCEKYEFIVDGENPYTFELFLEYFIFCKPNKQFLMDDDFEGIESHILKENNLLLTERLKKKESLSSSLLAINLPFSIEQEEELEFNFKNKKVTFIRAYKIILEEIFNQELDVIYKNDSYELKENTSIEIINLVFGIIQSRFENCRKRFSEYFPMFIQFSFVESLFFASKNNLTTDSFLLKYDKDKQKTDIHENVIEKLLIEKKHIYNELVNLPNDRRGGNKPKKDDNFINRDTKAAIKKLQLELKDIKQNYNINIKNKALFDKKLKNLAKLQKNEPEMYEKMTQAYEYLKNKQDTIATNHADFENYIIKIPAEKLAYSIFIYENNITLTVEVLRKKLFCIK